MLVSNIYTAIQGEGVQTGVAMVLVRLHGCGVGCPWCDTKETWELNHQFQVKSLAEAMGTTPHYAAVSPTQILSYIQTNCPGPKWVLLTGGEPADQPLQPLVTILHTAGYKVALETSGTATGHLEAGLDWVCVSPKIDMPGGKPLIPAAIEVADELKHVVGKAEDIATLDALLSEISLKPEVQICLQPVSRSRKATQLCIEVVQERGWRLSIQTHKYLDLP